MHFSVGRRIFGPPAPASLQFECDHPNLFRLDLRLIINRPIVTGFIPGVRPMKPTYRWPDALNSLVKWVYR